MSKIFISYRRDDSADISGRLYDHLIPPVGPFAPETVFKDVDSIPLGVNFKKHLETQVAQCDLCLIVIGPQWATIRDEHGNLRLHDPRDFVRIEVETALKREIPVIPLLVMNARMPSTGKLPPSLAALAKTTGMSIRPEPNFKLDMNLLIKELQPLIGGLDPRLDLFDKNYKGYWCHVPAGMYPLGSDEDSDNPKHDVNLSAFSIAKYPITCLQFQAFIDASDGYQNPSWWSNLHADGFTQQKSEPGEQKFKIDNHLRENVSWYDAMAFCRWLSAKLGYEVRLPTEDEWEAAARGKDQRQYPYGNDFDSAKCNTRESEIGQISSVDQFPNGASPFGVLDMSGNVWQWMYNDYKSKSVNDSSNNSKVVNGGSWFDDQNVARAAYRDDGTPDDRYDDLGFRLVVGGDRSLAR